MDTTLQKEQEAQAVTADGHSRDTVSGDISDTIPPDSALVADLLKRVGKTLYGTHWQADFAKQIGFSKAQITRWLNGSRTMPPTLNIALQQVVIERILILADLLAHEGMPDSPDLNDVVEGIEKSAFKLKLPE